MKFAVVTDSSADLPEQYLKEADVTRVSFYVSMDGETYLREGTDIPVTDFYRMMIENGDCYPKTSMPSVQDYMDAFLPHVKEKMPVLCVCLTSVFSGSYQSALTARTEILEDYPDAEIQVVDSMLVTALEGLFVKEAVRLRDGGLTLQEAVPLLEEIRGTGQIFFTTKDLKYLEHGGRLSHAASVAGSMLDLKPILRYHDGNLAKPEVCRGRRKSLQKILDEFFRYVKKENLDLSEYMFGTGIGAENEEYPEFVKMLEQRFEETGMKPFDWQKIQIGATIGVHTGPWPMGLGILKKCSF